MTDTTTLREVFEKMGKGATPIAVANLILAEIEARCAARGLTDLVAVRDGTFRSESIADFIAELRGELS